MKDATAIQQGDNMTAAVSSNVPKKRVMSPAAREKISASQAARWARLKAAKKFGTPTNSPVVKKLTKGIDRGSRKVSAFINKLLSLKETREKLLIRVRLCEDAIKACAQDCIISL